MEGRRQANESPYARAWPVSKATYWWMLSLFTTAYKRPLTQDDVYDPIHYLTSNYNYEPFIKEWDKLSLEKKERRGSLFRVLLLHFRFQILRGYVLYFIADSCKLCLFVTLRYLVETLGTGTKGVIPQTSWGLLGIIMLLALTNSLMATNGMRMVRIVELRIKLILGTLVYRKILKLSRKAMQDTNSGQIVSLLSADIEAINLGLAFLYGWFSAPLMVMAVFLYEGLDIGLSCLVGLALLAIVLVIQYQLGETAGKLRLKQAAWTDKRVFLMNEIIKAMKVIKMYCWEKPYANIARKLRRSEMKVQLWRSILVAASMGAGYPVIKLMIYVIIVFRVLNGQTISFLQSIAMIGVLRMIEMTIFRFLSPSFVNVKEIIASTDRIKKFLLMEEKMFSDTSPQKVDRINKEILNLKDLTAQWPKPNDGGHPFTIKDIQLNICKGEGVAVVGKVGSGKSTLLQACLDELIVMKGSCKVSGAVAYVPQDPWIMSETVRDNILLGEEYRREKYEAIIRACALEEDLSGFPEGDMTLVGERGLTLSGGQKARVGLARAVYQDADLYLFDDPLSAVDGKVAKKLFFECINGLLKNKARILVTHQLHFIPHIDKVVVLKQGRVLASGEYENVKVIVKENIEVEEKGHKRTLAKLVYDEEQRNDNMEWAKKEQLVYKREDTNEHGGVDNFVYLSYAKAGKGIILLPIFLLLYFASMAVGVFHDWLLVTWSRLRSVEIGNQTVVAGEEYDDTFLEFLNPSANKTAFLIPLGVLIILNLILYMVAFIVLMCMCTLASYNLYNRMFIRLFKAPSHFFETSPVGLILNRFSRDTAFMDIYLIMPLLIAFFDAGPCIPDVVYVLISNLWCIIPIICYIIILSVFYTLLVPGMRETKRLEASMRSPIFSHVSSTLDGLSVIRAMKKEKMFLERCNYLMDQHSSAWFNHICTLRALTFTVDFMSVFLISTSLIAMLLDFDIAVDDPGTVGLAFIYLPGLLLNVSLGFIYVAQFGIIMTSVERIQQYANLEQEAPDQEDFRPPVDWPQEGRISMKDVTLSYRGQCSPALGPISFEIQPGEKIGVVGRTGAGKSTLFVVLLRMVEAKGEIIIDGINIKHIGLSDLRGCVSVIPQDPVLFSQSLRHNLDPFNQYTDVQLWTVLAKVQLKDKVNELPGKLDATMGESANNFSVGEKQLLCLARSVLRRSRIVLVDEATANVDNRTDAIIQKTLHESLAESTVITIAHRLDTLIGSDKIMVLEGGQVVEMDGPYNLLQNASGAFSTMVTALGSSNLKFFQNATREYMERRRNGKNKTS